MGSAPGVLLTAKVRESQNIPFLGPHLEKGHACSHKALAKADGGQVPFKVSVEEMVTNLSGEGG